MTTASYAQRVVILTGASRGIGLASLSILLKRGVRVVALSRTGTDELLALKSEYPTSLVVCKGDVAKDEDNKSAVDVAIKSFDRLDALILNAGTLSPLGKTSSMVGKLDEYESLFKINFFSLVSILGHSLPHLRTAKEGSEAGIHGRVVLVSSGASTGGVSGWGAYSASKAAMNSLGRTLGNEEPSVVTISIRPGVVDTAMQTAIRETGAAHMLEADHTKFSALHTSGSLVQPHQPGGVLAGLALEAEASLSGTFVSWNDEPLEKYLLQ